MPARPRRWPRRLALAALALAALTALALAWLLHSGAGRDAALANLQARLPPGALTWTSAEGAVAGPLVLHGLRLDLDGTTVAAARADVDLALLPALGGTLRLDRLVLEDVRVALPPPDDAPFQPPRWPESMPRLPVPVPVQVGVLQVRGLDVRREGASVFAADTLDGESVGLVDEGLALGRLAFEGAAARGALSGEYRPARGFRTDLRGELHLPAAADGDEAPNLRLVATGDLDQLALDLAGRTPARLNVSLRLQGGRQLPDWTLQAMSEGLPPAWLGDPGDAPAWSGELRASGRGGEAALEGHVQVDGLRIGIAPSQVGLVEDRLLLRPLNLELPEGPLRATGQVQYSEDAPRFDLQLASEGLALVPATDEAGALPVAARGELRVRGEPGDWTLSGHATLRRDGEEAALVLAGAGDTAGLRLDTLQATMPTGTLDGRGRVAWSPALALGVDARLAGFDPGYFLPDYPGALRGDLRVDATRGADADWSGTLALQDLGGTLRGRAVGGRLALDWRGDRGTGEADLRLGASAVQARGGFGAAWDLQARFAPLALADLVAGAAGELRGTLSLQGPAAAPDLAADLAGEGLAWDGLRAGAVRVQGTLPARAGRGELALGGRDLDVDGLVVDTLLATISGTQARADLRLALAGPHGRAEAQGALARAGATWSGELAALRLAPEPGPVLQLQSPAAFRFGPGEAVLARACLVADGHPGRVCASARGDDALLEAEDLPLALLQPWLPVDEGVPMHLEGRVVGQARLQRGRDGGWRGGGRFASPLGALRLDADAERVVFGYRDLGLDWTLSPEAIDAEVSAALAGEGQVRGRLRAGRDPAGGLAGEFAFDIRELTWLELFSEDLAAPTGRLQGTLALAGTRAAPALSGQARLAGFAAELPALGLKLREGEFTLLGQPGGLARIDGSVLSGEGRLRVDGSLDPGDAAAPLRLVLQGRGVTLASTAEAYVVADPDLQLSLADGTLRVRGRVDVPEARLDLEALDTEVAVSPDVVVVDPRDPPRRRDLPLDLDFTLALGGDVKLKGFGLDGRVAGTLGFRQRPGRAATASGGLDVSGRYRAYGQSLEIRRARLGYAASPVDNPTLDLLAERSFDEATVGVQVRGTARRPETTVVSNPAMETSEALAWLVLGRPLRTASGFETEQLDAAAMALGAGGNLVAQQVGARLGLDEAGVTDSRNLGGATFTVGKYVTPRLFLSYGVSLAGTGQVVTLKYLLARGFDISIESGNESAGSLNWRTER